MAGVFIAITGVGAGTGWKFGVSRHPQRRHDASTVRAGRRYPPVAILALACLLAACAPISGRSHLAALPAPDAAAPPDQAGFGSTDRPVSTLSPAEIASLDALPESEILKRLGTPDFRRHEPPAELWQYSSETCVLNLFLYPEAGAMKVALATTLDRQDLQKPANTCSPFPGAKVASSGTS